MTNAHMEQEKKYRYGAGFLAAIAYNLVRTFEMEQTSILELISGTTIPYLTILATNQRWISRVKKANQKL
jgi:hypothetical protein